MMKIGFIFECGPQGADKQVCEYLAGRLRPDLQVVSRTLDNKPRLLCDAGKVAVELLADGCRCVLIVWDLRPAWPDTKNRPCRHKECEALLQSLKNVGIAQNQAVYLVCIEQELESWLLADENNISAYLSTDAHPYKARRESKPDRVSNPKSVMMNHFRQARGQRYNDLTHAIKVISTNSPDSPNWNKLRKSDSFARFERKVLTCEG